MKRTIHSVLMLVFVLWGFNFLGCQAQAADDQWLKFDHGLAKAGKESKPMLVDFYTDWCHWCKVMDEKTFQDPKVRELLKARFVTVRLNAENANENVTFQNRTMNNTELTRAMGISGYPSLAFIAADGKPITVVPGYVPPEDFLQILNYIDQKCYEKQISFDEFKKTGGCKSASKS